MNARRSAPERAASSRSRPVAAPAPPPARRLRLSPINRRRLDNFKRNRRGYWSFWIFLAILFVLSLFAEFIANDRPISSSYKGEILFPVFVDYPEEKFGGFLAATDYRDPVDRDEIEAHGWMLWPPIRFSYATINLDLPTPAPSPPTWMLTDAQCAAAARRERNKARDAERAAAATSNGTGSAPTTRAATWSRG